MINIVLRILLRFLGNAHYLFGRCWLRLLEPCYRAQLAECGRGVRIDPRGSYSFANIHVGDHVSLGSRPVLMAALSTIRIGHHVMFGPEVVVIAGNHNTAVVGRFMAEVQEKRPEDDIGVVIEDDVWVGSRAIILRGVTLGRGAVVAAGAVVTKSVPPYAVVACIPARVMRFRWDVETILRHETALYSLDQRLAREDLERWQKERVMLPPLRKQ